MIFNFDYRLIPKAMRNIFRDGEAPELYMNSVEHFRDYLFVEDAVRAYFHIARCHNCHGRVYNLPGALYASTPDVLREIVSHIGTLQQRAAEKDPDSHFANHRWNHSIQIVPSRPEFDHDFQAAFGRHAHQSRNRLRAENQFSSGFGDDGAILSVVFREHRSVATPDIGGQSSGNCP